jgi:hypothetical protein
MAEQIQSTIGGYFGLELRKGSPYHVGSVALNSGRNALEYILRSKPPVKIYIPNFTCVAISKKISEMGIEIEFYGINELMEPVFDFKNINESEAFLYTNYFGLKNKYIEKLAGLGCRFIIDNAHSFFSPQVENFETFYSPRKFFGVPDGGYAFSSYAGNLEQDYSNKRTTHLLLRHDDSAQAGYAAYLNNENLLARTSIRAMSKLTTLIMESIDFNNVVSIRKRNFQLLHLAIGKSNLLPIVNDIENVALTYPYLTKDINLRKTLLENNIFTAKYWAEVSQNENSSKLELYYAECIVHLPIDQRCDENDISRILQFIKL